MKERSKGLVNMAVIILWMVIYESRGSERERERCSFWVASASMFCIHRSAPFWPSGKLVIGIGLSRLSCHVW